MDNTTPLNAGEYDAGIEKTVPFYSSFYDQTIDLVKSFGFPAARWLDTGCGTGALILRAAEAFPDYRFTLCDPSPEMIATAREKLSGLKAAETFGVCSSQALTARDEFEVVTAIQCHHYLQPDERAAAVRRCYEALTVGGVYISFENTAPATELGKRVALERWGRYQAARGKAPEAVAQHQARYGTKYFPITLEAHKALLVQSGFHIVELFWHSYMQAGLYAVK